MTVLFADVSPFTWLAERVEPEHVERLDRAARVAADAERLDSETVAALFRAVWLLAEARVSEAIAPLEPALAVCREKRFVGQSIFAHELRDAVRAHSAGWRRCDARERGDRASRTRRRDERSRTALAEADPAAGESDVVERVARDGVATTRRFGERGCEATVHAILADIACARGMPPTRARRLEEAGALASEAGCGHSRSRADRGSKTAPPHAPAARHERNAGKPGRAVSPRAGGTGHEGPDQPTRAA